MPRAESMQRFHCVCGNEVFFESMQCIECARALGFAPERMQMLALDDAGHGLLRLADTADFGERYRFCANRQQAASCNWLIAVDDIDGYCRACRTTEVIPSLAIDANAARWQAMESAKRRLPYSLLRLNLEFETQGPYGTPPMRFAFKEDHRTNPLATEGYVTTGHVDGVITINVAEADAGYREQIRESLGQGYRTVLGHLRHESGHFFFDRLVRPSPALETYRALFGDESEDYAAALDAFYRDDQRHTGSEHVSAYASAHPLEDWAECWAHALHIEDTLETATAYGLSARYHISASAPWLERWRAVSVMLNELNRSLGQPDAYPFVITNTVALKLDFIRDLIRQAGHAI